MDESLSRWPAVLHTRVPMRTQHNIARQRFQQDKALPKGVWRNWLATEKEQIDVQRHAQEQQNDPD